MSHHASKRIRRQDSFIDDTGVSDDSASDSDSDSSSSSDDDGHAHGRNHENDDADTDADADADAGALAEDTGADGLHWRDRAAAREQAKQAALERAGETSYDAFARLMRDGDAATAYETSYGKRDFLPRVTGVLETFGNAGSVASRDRQLVLRESAEDGVMRIRASDVGIPQRCAACGLARKPCTFRVRLATSEAADDDDVDSDADEATIMRAAGCEWLPLGGDCVLKVRALRRLYDGVRGGEDERSTRTRLCDLEDARDQFFQQVIDKQYGRKRGR